MKKLLVLALVVVMVLAFAAVSMAATTTFTGEADFVYVTSPTVALSNEFDLVATVAVNDTVTVAGGFKVANPGSTFYSVDKTKLPVDPLAAMTATPGFTVNTWSVFAKPISVAIKTSDTGKFTLYNDSFNMGGDMDCLTKGMADISSNVGMKYTDTVAEGVTINVGVYPNVGGVQDKLGYGLGVAYAADALGLSFGYSKSAKDVAGYVVNADYKLGDFKPFLQYGVPQVDTGITATASKYVGALYQQADGPFGARLEYGLVDSGTAPTALYLDYKVNDILFRLINTNIASVSTTSLKVKVAF